MSKKDFLTDQDVIELILSNSKVTLKAFAEKNAEPKYGKSIFLKYNHTTGVFQIDTYYGKTRNACSIVYDNVKDATIGYNTEVELCLNGK